MKHSEYLKEKQKDFLKNESMTAGLFDFYMRIFQLQEEFDISADTVELFEGYVSKDVYPALNADDMIFDEKTKWLLSDHLLRLTGVIQDMNPGMDFSLLTDNFKRDGESFLRALLKGDYDFLERKGIENRMAIEEFLFVLNKIYKPLMVAVREKFFIRPPKDEWMENVCPFCGYLPDMSKIVESKDNMRVLHCALCENDWVYPRLLCAACGSSDQAKNGFFEYEENTNYRIYYCDECRHYIKSIRLSKLQEESSCDLAVEDIITGFLDAGMIDKGYRRI